jgi:hypothetical protein
MTLTIENTYVDRGVYQAGSWSPTTDYHHNAPTPVPVPAPQPRARMMHGVHVFGEHQLVPRPDDGRVLSSLPLAPQLLAETNPAVRTQIIRSAIHALGFNWMGYGAIRSVGGRMQPMTFFETYAPRGWGDRYLGRRHYEIDPRFPRQGYFGLPMVWDIQDLESNAGPHGRSGRLGRFLADMHETGIGSGIFQTVANPASNEFTIISLLSSRTSRDWITDSVIGRSLLISLSLHEYLANCTEIQAPRQHPCEGLGGIRVAILQHLAQGMSDKQIANCIGMSVSNIDYHMRRLRTHFNVRSRLQLIKASGIEDYPGQSRRFDNIG